jgi:membrane-associated phospholipid phosphatase
MAVVSLLTLALFALTTWQIAVKGPLWDVDVTLDHVLRHGAPPARVAELFADLGSVAVAVPVLVMALACALVRRRGASRLAPLWAVPAMAAVPLIVLPLKSLLHRAGPLGGTNYYPSGHAATAAVAFGGAALLLTRALPRCRTWAFSVAAVLVAGNGAGLIWRGYHWPLDVVASWCLGWLLLTVSTAAARRAEGPRAARRGGPVTAQT